MSTPLESSQKSGMIPNGVAARTKGFFGFLTRSLPSIQVLKVLCDYLTVVGVYIASYQIYVHGLGMTSPQSFQQHTVFAILVGILYVIIEDRVGLYRREVSLLNIKELRGLFRVGLYSAALILSICFYVRDLNLSRVTMTLALVMTPVALMIERALLYRLQLMLHERGFAHRRVLIIGTGKEATQIAKRMLQSPGLGLLPIGFLDSDPEKKDQQITWPGRQKSVGLPILGDLSVVEQVKELGVNYIVIAHPQATSVEIQSYIDACLDKGLDYALVPREFGRFMHSMEMFQIGSVPLLQPQRFDVSFYYFTVKRLIDFAVVTFFLLLLSPFLILFWLLIKMDSPGPVIFKQKRVGLNGRQFTMYKFRTMRTDTEKYSVTPNSSTDPRITMVGRWLRRTSLDELPQLFNVFRGDMSIVGPRPEMPFIVEEYTPTERLRLLAKPGITGVWQISAARGEPIHKNLEYDLFYLQNRSILLDLAVIVKTIFSVVRGIGAF